MIEEKDLKWHIKHANNIESNPIVSEYCIIDYGDGEGRIYEILMMQKADYTGLTHIQDEYKYFCFFECFVKKIEEPMSWFDTIEHYSGYEIRHKTLIQVYDTLDEAKKRAYYQYTHIFDYVVQEAGLNAEEESKLHFVV